MKKGLSQKDYFNEEFLKHGFFSPSNIHFVIYDKEIWRLAKELLAQAKKVVDLGCGVGAFSFFIAESVGCHVTGINLSKYQIQIANKKKKQLKQDNVEFIEMDIMDMKKIRDKYDAAFLIDVGVHFPDKKKAFQNIYKIMRSDSRLVIGDWLQKDSPSPAINEIITDFVQSLL